VIGGPPHSGKSVLTYSLTRALRAQGIAHYVLRAYPPDGEGDWFLEGDPEQVRHFRIKGLGAGDPWLPLLKEDVARRHLPLIVDLGGLPTPEQETLLDGCTHALLHTPTPAAHDAWQVRMKRHGLVLLADLHSDLHGENRLEQEEPVVRGTLAGLERGQRAAGPAFAALVRRLAELFGHAGTGLRRRHLAAAPVELAVDVERLAEHLDVTAGRWQPDDLPAVLGYLPQGQPLALYGRGPNWLYAAVAAHALPAPFHLFDVRRGWVAPPSLCLGPAKELPALEMERHTLNEMTLLEFRLPQAYLDLEDFAALQLPLESRQGLALSGKLPQWLWAALVRAARAPWLAVFQPQLGGAVIVRGTAKRPGSVVAVA
jgi:CRISPR-associated protein Csx3